MPTRIRLLHFHLVHFVSCLVGLLILLTIGWGALRSGHAKPYQTPLAPKALQGEAALHLLKESGHYDSLQRAMEATQYRAQPTSERPGEYAALNPAQELHARFTPQGVEVRRRSDEATPKLAISLRSIGYSERQSPVSPGTVSAQDQRIEIHRAINDQPPTANLQPTTYNLPPITEWYVNHPSGLEQGFTISQPPGERQASARLRLTLEVAGEWQATLAADGQAVEFSEAGGSTMRYDHLAVRDAQGTPLPARMSLEQSELRLEVEDGGAHWPLTIDPILAQQAYLKPSNTKQSILFGRAVAISGDTVVVGGHGEPSNATGVNGDQSDNSANFAGAAYVFVRNGAGWSQQAYLKASNTGAQDQFGLFVAISGDTIVVGAPAEDSSATGINGDGSNNSASGSGAAYVFVRSGTTWSQQAYLKASNTEAGDSFGWSVGISGDTVVVGALSEDSNATGVNGNPTDNSATNAGAAYVFVRNGTTWSQQAYLKASNTGAGDRFGQSVAISGDTLVIGAYGEASNATGINGNQNDDSAPQSGAAYVFVRSGTIWSQQAYLKASNTGAGDQFGYSAAISGDTVVIGADFEDSNATGINGNQNDNSTSSAGAAYVFVRSGTVWTQQAYLKASNTDAGDVFGYAVAISGDTIVVSAALEASNATGVNGDQSNNSVPLAGAAYVFMRSGTIWSQQAYLKASNPGPDDDFGESVGISGDTVVVGALAEDSMGPRTRARAGAHQDIGQHRPRIGDQRPGKFGDSAFLFETQDQCRTRLAVARAQRRQAALTSVVAKSSPTKSSGASRDLANGYENASPKLSNPP